MARAPSAIRKVSHVIFDMDGLLLDTERLYTEATQNVVSMYGKEYTWDLKSRVMGMKSDDVAALIVRELRLPISPGEYAELARRQYVRLFPGCELMPDTEGVYKRVIASIAAGYGRTYTPEIRAKLLGTQEADSSRIAVEEMRLPVTWQDFLKVFSAESKKLLHNCPLMPGAERLVKHLHKNSVPIAVATSSSQESYELKTHRHRDFFKLFNHTVTGSTDPEVKQGKPSPDIFLVCAGRFVDAPKPASCLVFEDAPNGVQAAISAGMQCVMVPDEHIDPELTKQATVVLRNLEVVKPELFGLPGF